MKKVGIIGGSGFIGSYITKQFLDHDFEVKVSATDISKKEKYAHLSNLTHSEKLQISDNERKLNVFGMMKSLNMLIETGDGFDYTFDDFNKWAKKIGFSSTELLPLVGHQVRPLQLNNSKTNRDDYK